MESLQKVVNEAVPEHRLTCYECHKPATLCVCSTIRRVDNRTEIVVLQHPRERLHPIGTARFARLGLSRARVEVAWNAGKREDVAPSWVPADAALLYPGAGARDLRELSAAERPRHLVVIDGTWHTARTLFRDKAWLQALPRVRLAPSEPSRYRIRREPTRDSLSTIEAIVLALRILEPATPGLDELLGAFDSMIDAQLAFVEGSSGRPRERDRRPLERRRLPIALVEDFDRLVVVYVESARPDPRGHRALTQLAAVSLSTGETFERLVVPAFGLPGSAHLAHMCLTEEDFGAAVSASQFRHDVEQFLGRQPRPLIAAWNQSSLDVLATELGQRASRVALKSAYRNVRGSGSGSLDEVVVSEGLEPAPLAFRGRAGTRMARAVAIARYLNAMSTGGAPLR
jgi:DTW domain-containing protein YfiP